MKKTFKTFVILGVMTIVVALPLAAIAQTTAASPTTLNISGKLGTVGAQAGYGSTPLAQTLGRIINIFLSILGVLFLIYTVYAGYLYLISSGNEEKVDKAKSILRGSIIGLIIVLAAYAITRFVIYGVGQATGYNVGQTQSQNEVTAE